MWDVYKNKTIVPYEDAGGIINTAYDGETTLGEDFFTGAELEDADEVISRRIVCDRCGCAPKRKSELVKQKGWMICARCIDG